MRGSNDLNCEAIANTNKNQKISEQLLASGKLVVGDGSSEGSQTAKSGTDEQERYMRHKSLG